MKIGVISDSHDHIENLRKALEKLKACDVLLHCGDLIMPSVTVELGKFNGQVHVVFGNNEGEQFNIVRKCPENVILYKPMAELELGGKKIAVVHYNHFADALASTGKYDAVFYGHTHKKDKHKINDTWVVNPGDLMNLHNEMGYAIYDTDKNEVTLYEL